MTPSIHMTRRKAIIATASAVAMCPAFARAAELSIGETGRVASVPDGRVFALASGLRVRLAAIQTPRLSEPWGREAKDGLAGLLRGREVQLSYGGDPRDRYDRALAQVHTLAGNGMADLWVQAEMVRLGLARVYTWPDERVDARALYRLEEEARARKRGLWAHPAYAVRAPDPDPLAQHVDSLQLVEGFVTSSVEVRRRVYLNFGADYRTDFTVAIAAKHRRRFKTMDPLSLDGARVRVRGWIELINGPMIWANHPERIEILDGIG